MRYLMLLALLSALPAFSCKDEATAPVPSGAPFSLRITVDDTAGAALPGIRVAGGSLLSGNFFQGIAADWWVNAVYVGRMSARDSLSGALLFRDSIYLVFADVDPLSSRAMLGVTGSDGKLTLTDAGRFPGLLALPAIPQTETDPTVVGHFTILDTAAIVLVDTVSQQRMNARIVLRNGTNALNVVWRSVPAAARGGDVSERRGTVQPAVQQTLLSSPLAQTVVGFQVPVVARVNLSFVHPDGSPFGAPLEGVLAPGAYRFSFYTGPSSAPGVPPLSRTRISAGMALEWKLNQNYPNPFN